MLSTATANSRNSARIAGSAMLRPRARSSGASLSRLNPSVGSIMTTTVKPRARYRSMIWRYSRRMRNDGVVSASRLRQGGVIAMIPASARGSQASSVASTEATLNRGGMWLKPMRYVRVTGAGSVAFEHPTDAVVIHVPSIMPAKKRPAFERDVEFIARPAMAKRPALDSDGTSAIPRCPTAARAVGMVNEGGTSPALLELQRFEARITMDWMTHARATAALRRCPDTTRRFSVSDRCPLPGFRAHPPRANRGASAARVRVPRIHGQAARRVVWLAVRLQRAPAAADRGHSRVPADAARHGGRVRRSASREAAA